MIKRIKRKYAFIIMTSVIIVLGLIITGINATNYSSIGSLLDDKLTMLVENDGLIPEVSFGPPPTPPESDESGGSDDAAPDDPDDPDNPNNPDNPDTPDDPDNPFTGDRVWNWLAALLISGGLALGMILADEKRRTAGKF